MGGVEVRELSSGHGRFRRRVARERNWLPLAVAAAVVLAVAAVAIIALEHGKSRATVTPISAAPDAYAASLPITRMAMSESANLAGGKVTYLDGHIANLGGRTVTGITVQVLFRDPAHEVAQNETHPLKLIRIRDPYIDLEPVSAAPLKPGGEQEVAMRRQPASSRPCARRRARTSRRRGRDRGRSRPRRARAAGR